MAPEKSSPLLERGDRGLGRQRPGPQDAVLVHHGEPHRPQPLRQDPFRYLARERDR